MGKLKSFQEQVQESVEKGIAAVEEQHKALAEKSFGYAEKVESEAKSYSIKTVHDLHNDAVKGMYESVRAFNKRVNDFAVELLNKVEKEEVAKKAPAKKAAAKKAPVKKTAAKAAEAVTA